MNGELSIACFSPTGTTRRVLAAIAEGIGAKKTQWMDLTRPEGGGGGSMELSNGALLIGAPVYGGRVPSAAVERFKRLRGNGVPAVIVAVYGNRAYDDALLELKDLAAGAGFVPLAAAAFIGEHSFAGENAPIAMGRPDDKDLVVAREFGERAGGRLLEFAESGKALSLEVPGGTPYKEQKPQADFSPVTREDLCTLCGTCAELCPTGAIVVDGRVITDAPACIHCHACVKGCPEGARVMEAEPIKLITAWLLANCMDRREPEIFI